MPFESATVAINETTPSLAEPLMLSHQINGTSALCQEWDIYSSVNHSRPVWCTLKLFPLLAIVRQWRPWAGHWWPVVTLSRYDFAVTHLWFQFLMPTSRKWSKNSSTWVSRDLPFPPMYLFVVVCAKQCHQPFFNLKGLSLIPKYTVWSCSSPPSCLRACDRGWLCCWHVSSPVHSADMCGSWTASWMVPWRSTPHLSSCTGSSSMGSPISTVLEVPPDQTHTTETSTLFLFSCSSK